MTEGMEAVTVTALGLALDAASIRQQAIATNIANVNTLNYAPLKASFEDQLEDARNALQSHGRLDAASLAGVRPILQIGTPDAPGLLPAVQLDVEVAGMARNAVQYQALIKGLSKHYAILSSAVSDGKR